MPPLPVLYPLQGGTPGPPGPSAAYVTTVSRTSLFFLECQGSPFSEFPPKSHLAAPAHDLISSEKNGGATESQLEGCEAVNRQ